MSDKLIPQMKHLTEDETIEILRVEFSDLFDIDEHINKRINMNSEGKLICTLDFIVIGDIILQNRLNKTGYWIEFLYGKEQNFWNKSEFERNACLINYLRENRDYVGFLLL